VTGLSADFESHRIEGFARAAIERGEEGSFSVPLISQVADALFMGGCIDGVSLGDEFDFVLSLYPWEQYALSPGTARLEVKLYDHGEIPDTDLLVRLAKTVDLFRGRGNVLVHCQAGLNRSGLLSALALMLDGDEPEVAIHRLRDERSPVVLCNETFERWLVTEARGVLSQVIS
jgi:hypothetical protein